MQAQLHPASCPEEDRPRDVVGGHGKGALAEAPLCEGCRCQQGLGVELLEVSPGRVGVVGGVASPKEGQKVNGGQLQGGAAHGGPGGSVTPGAEELVVEL